VTFNGTDEFSDVLWSLLQKKRSVIHADSQKVPADDTQNGDDVEQTKEAVDGNGEADDDQDDDDDEEDEDDEEDDEIEADGAAVLAKYQRCG